MEYEKPTATTAFQKKRSSTKHPYDGVFLSTGLPVKLGPRKSDYEEIFQGSGSSSIPFIDFDQEKAYRFDARSSMIDYSKIFGGFGDAADFAVPFEDLAASSIKPNNSQPRSRSPAEARTLGSSTGHSSVSKEKHVPSPKETYQSFDGVKQFNVSYNRTNPGSKSVENGMTSVAQLDAVNGLSRLIDETAPLPLNEGGKPVRSVLNDAHINVSNVGEPLRVPKLPRRAEPLRVPKLPRRAVSGPQPRVAANDTFPSHTEPRKISGRNRSTSDDMSSDAFEIGLGTYSSGMPSSPLSTTPEAANHKGSSNESTSLKIGASRSKTFKRAADSCSPPSVDEEVDTNSVAAASAAAVRKAIEEAQAKIKVAKELMERKKEGRLNFAKLNFDNGLKAEKRDAKTAEKSFSSRERKGLDLNGKEDSMKDGGHLNFANFNFENGLKMKKRDATVEKANSSSEKEGWEMNGKEDGHLNLAKFKSDCGLKAETGSAKTLQESNSSRENEGREMIGKQDISKQSIARLSKLDETKASQLTPNLKPEPEISRAQDITGKPRNIGSSFTQVDHNAEGNHDGETRRQLSEAVVANKHVARALESQQADGMSKVTPSADVNEWVPNMTAEKRQMECGKRVEVFEDDAKLGKVDSKLDPIEGLFAWIFNPNSIMLSYELEYEKAHILEASTASKNGEAIQISKAIHEHEQLESNPKEFEEQDIRKKLESQGQNHDMQEMQEIIDRVEIADHEAGECIQGEMETRAAKVLVVEDNQNRQGEGHEQNDKEKGHRCEMEVDCEENQEEGSVLEEIEKKKNDAHQEGDTETNLGSSSEDEVVELGCNDVQGKEESDCRHSEDGRIEEYEQLEVVDKSERIADGDRQKDIPECRPRSTLETERIMPENCLISQNEKVVETVQNTLRDQRSNFVVADVLCNQEQNENLSVADEGCEHRETLEGIKVTAEIITSNQNDRTIGLTRDTHINEESGKEYKAVDDASHVDEEGILEATCPAQGFPRLDGFDDETAYRTATPDIKKNAGYVDETDMNSEQKQTNLNCDERSSIGLTRDTHTFEESGKEPKALEDTTNVDEEGILEATCPAQCFPRLDGFDDEAAYRTETPGIKKNAGYVVENDTNSEQKQTNLNCDERSIGITTDTHTFEESGTEPKAVEDSSNVDEEGILEATFPAQGFPTFGGFDDETACRIETPGIKKNEEFVNETNLNSEQKQTGDNLPSSLKDSEQEKHVEEVFWESEENDEDADDCELSCHSEESENCFIAGNSIEFEILHEPEPMESKRHNEPELKETFYDMEKQVEEDMDADKVENFPVHGEEDNSSQSSHEERWMNIEEHLAVQQHSLSERNWNTTEMSEEEKSCHSPGTEEENHHEIEDREAGSQMQTEVENPCHLERGEAKQREMHEEAGQQPCSSEGNRKTTRMSEENKTCQSAGKEEENHHKTDGREAGSQMEIEVENRHHVKKGEAKEREMEKEREKKAVERVIREARERAFAEARERAERAAVERAAAEARQKATVEGSKRSEKAPAEANAKPAANKAAVEAKLKVERAAVERATAEARERALEKALAEKAASKATNQAAKVAAEKFSTGSTNDGAKSSNNAPIDHQQKGPAASSNSRHSSSSNHGVPNSIEQVPNFGSAYWSKATLEREQRMAERAAKALAEKNMRDLLAQKEQAERNRLAETLDADVKRWSSGKERNLRALLSTLQYILGPDSGWQPIPLTDLISTAAVKKAYRKATLFVHPDKLQQRGASIQQKYVCEKVFDLLKDAWNKFNAEEK